MRRKQAEEGAQGKAEPGRRGWRRGREVREREERKGRERKGKNVKRREGKRQLRKERLEVIIQHFLSGEIFKSCHQEYITEKSLFHSSLLCIGGMTPVRQSNSNIAAVQRHTNLTHIRTAIIREAVSNTLIRSLECHLTIIASVVTEGSNNRNVTIRACPPTIVWCLPTRLRRNLDAK